jgi:type I site-specific restriction endonuclease
MMDKRGLSERDICTKFITPALRQAGWDEMPQIREVVSFTEGRILFLADRNILLHQTMVNDVRPFRGVPNQ